MLTMLMFVSYTLLRRTFTPPPVDVAENQPAEVEDSGTDDTSADDDATVNTPSDDESATDDTDEPQDPPTDDGEDSPNADPTESESAASLRKQIKPQWVTLGSVAPKSKYRMLVILNNQGAAIERAELSSPKYLDLEDDTGYFGHLALSESKAGPVVNAVGDGTPASKATCTKGDGGAGLQVGDVILTINGETPTEDETHTVVQHAEEMLHRKSPGSEITVEVRRGEGANAKTLTYQATLSYPHLQVIQPDLRTYTDRFKAVKNPPMQPLSFLMQLENATDVNMHKAHWEVVTDASKPDEVTFRLPLDAADFGSEESGRNLEVLKRYKIATFVPESEGAAIEDPAYHVTMSIEVKNLGEEPTPVQLELQGPTGLPLEGWWYVRKGSPHWGSAGARDVVYRYEGGRNQIFRLPVIYDYDEALAEGEQNDIKDPPEFDFSGEKTLDYAGVDTQYFSAVMVPDRNAPGFSPADYRFADQGGRAMTTGARLKKWKQTTGISFDLKTRPHTIPPGESFRQQYTVFIGPKDPQVLEEYGLGGTIIFGWSFFGAIAKFLLWILHGIYFVVRNYGIAIILLTVLVRLAVLPIGRKQAQNAAKMQELAPQLKAITEKHKDMEQRAKAQQELFKSHNYHPLGGCWMMFIQLPIFFGLYKALSTSIDLRQASLIPGLQWCSNLAGPDKFLRWDSFMPAMLAAENGFLGPYLNVLPLVTIGLFILQQKLFMPPATDEQTRMQQSMMKYMMIFMGFMFFKVPSGLCIYFIVSALWSIAERKLLPKPKAPSPVPLNKAEKDKDNDKPAPKPRPKKTKADLQENSLARMFNDLLSKANKATNGNGGDPPPGNRPKRKKKKRK